MLDNRWHCQKLKLTQDLAKASYKTYKSIFLFQGCKILYIRVPISLADIKIQFVACYQMIGKLSTNIAMLSELSVIFV